MHKLFTTITALGLSITFPAIAIAKQIATPTIPTNNINKVINKERNISKFSLSNISNDKQLIAQSVRRLNFSWRTAPLEMTVLVLELIMKGKVSDYIILQQLLRSGYDIYVVRVRLSNTGNVPLRVHPQNIKAYYGNKYTSVIPVADNRFLQPDILRPNYYIDKPVVFIAPRRLNLLRDVRMAYRDSSIRAINN